MRARAWRFPRYPDALLGATVGAGTVPAPLQGRGVRGTEGLSDELTAGAQPGCLGQKAASQDLSVAGRVGRGPSVLPDSPPWTTSPTEEGPAEGRVGYGGPLWGMDR